MLLWRLLPFAMASFTEQPGIKPSAALLALSAALLALSAAFTYLGESRSLRPW
jgi:hypothetical protein